MHVGYYVGTGIREGIDGMVDITVVVRQEGGVQVKYSTATPAGREVTSS